MTLINELRLLVSTFFLPIISSPSAWNMLYLVRPVRAAVRSSAVRSAAYNGARALATGCAPRNIQGMEPPPPFLENEPQLTLDDAPCARSTSQPKIVWTYTDEAPALATFALLPVVERFAKPAGLTVDCADISVAGRILSNFPECLKPEQRVKDELGELGELAKTPAANIVKLPNVSASIPQLNAAIAELQEKGYAVPNYPASPSNEEEKKIAETYSKVLGSAVNPVLREGNSDRRVAGPVKAYAQKRPHKMGAWDPQSKTHVAHMSEGDFFGSELSASMASATSVRIELHPADGGAAQVLKSEVKLQAGEVIDAARMSATKLRAFFEQSLQTAKADNLMVSLHLKATMMKVSDPIMFGHAVEVFFKDAYAKHADTLAAAGVNAKNVRAESAHTRALRSRDLAAAGASRLPLLPP